MADRTRGPQDRIFNWLATSAIVAFDIIRRKL